MSTKHSNIGQIDGHYDDPQDDKYAGSKHYWAKGWLGGAFQSYIDTSEVIEDCDITDEEKKTEYAKLLYARNFSYFPPWTSSLIYI